MKHHTLRRGDVAALREAKGWNQTQFAELLGVSVPAVSQYESGSLQPSAETALKMARLLDVEFSAITAAKDTAEAEAS